MSKKRILFINLVNASFVKMDEQILREQFDVVAFKFRHRKGWRLIPEMIREFFFVLFKIVRVDLVYIWFADFHAVIPTLMGRLAGKKVIIVIGGYDAAHQPALNYGVKTRLAGRISAPVAIRFATHLLPVTQFTQRDLIKNFGPINQKKSTVIYNCYNNIFKCDIARERHNSVVTICLAHSHITVLRKGVDFYVEVAKQMPAVDFYVVGVTAAALHFLQTDKPPNLHLIEKIPQLELKNLLCKSKVICQFSRYEAFGIALLEGISAGCYPVGLNYGGTSEILENGLGLMIDELNVEKGKEAVLKALDQDAGQIGPIQKSIDERFAVDVRKQKLIDFLQKV